MLAFIMRLLSGLVSFVSGLLPVSPVATFAGSDPIGAYAEYLGFLNWFVPIGDMLSLMTAWLAALLIWYAVAFVKRMTVSSVIQSEVLT